MVGNHHRRDYYQSAPGAHLERIWSASGVHLERIWNVFRTHSERIQNICGKG